MDAHYRKKDEYIHKLEESLEAKINRGNFSFSS